VFVAKNRNGPDGLVYPIFMDTSCVSIKVLPPTDDTVEDVVEKTARQQLETLKQKYQTFKKEKSKNGVS
jgi:hypothetical protein